MVGRIIHNYQIVDTLGKGGMGTVYKALDLRLNRFLALKFLAPERMTADRKRRFFQEAKAASALNHPNIVHIYDIGQWEGADYIAMEHVEGRTIQQILREGALPIDTALRYAIQVADAMSVAHAANIVHRDLKPANVMVTSRGLVKILDFGVAKLNEPVHAPAAEPESKPDETQTVADTDQTLAGMIVGSPAYMSPEQARGTPVDARSDIFEFGLLLYEMLTAQPAFGGSTKLEVLSAILHTDPPRASTLNPAVTPELEWVIAHCLRKDRERRFQGMSEVKVALDDLRTETGVSGLHTTLLPASQRSASGVSSAGPLAPARRTWVWGIATAVGLLCATTLALVLLRPWKQAAPIIGPLETTRLTTEGGLCIDPAISPDGKLLAYASDRSREGHFDIWLRQIGGGDAVRLTHDQADDVEPDFSPDGTRIVFRSSREGGGLYMIPALGGEERKIANGGRQPQFSPDGSKIAYWTGPAGPLPLRDGVAHAYILDLATSATRRLRPDFAASTHPVWSPDGTHLVFIGLKDAKDLDTFNWWITAADGLSPAVFCPVLGDYYSLDPFAWRGGRVYFTRNDVRITIGEVQIDPKKFKPIGEPRALTSGTTNEYSPSVSKDGKLVFSSITGNTHLYSLPLDSNRGEVRETVQRLTSDAGVDIARSISGDGSRIAFTSERNGPAQIWVKDLTTGVERALTTGTAKTSPQITRDGKLVAWVEDDIRRHEIFVTPFEGGLARQVCAECGSPVSWSPDGRYVTYKTSPQTLVGLLDVATGNRVEYLKSASLRIGENSISPDGKWIVFAAHHEVRDFTIYVAPFSPGREPSPSEWIEIIRSPETGPHAAWSPDGKMLYFSSERDGYNCLWAQRLDPATQRPRGKLFAVQHFHSPTQPMAAPSSSFPIALAKDKVIVSLEERAGGIWMLTLRD